MKTRTEILRDLKEEYYHARTQAETIANSYLQYTCQIYPEFNELYLTKREIEFEIMKTKFECPEKIEADNKQWIPKLNQINDIYYKFINENNIDVSRFNPKYNCAVCEDSGYVNHNMCHCLRRELNRRLNKQNITRTLASWNKSITLDIERAKIQKLLKQWSSQYPNTNVSTILLLGTPGTGKTFDLECIASDLIARDIGVMFATAFEFNEQCRKYHCCQENSFNDFIRSDVLIIDDLGSEPILNNVTVEYLYNLIDSRQRNRRATLISSNLELNTLLSRYGERTFSRLNNINLGLTIKFTGDDLRRKELKEKQ